MRPIVLAAAASLFAITLGPLPTASAGIYVVGACRSGDIRADAWQAFPVTGNPVVGTCVPAEGLRVWGDLRSPLGTRRGWIFTAPMATKVVGFSALIRRQAPRWVPSPLTPRGVNRYVWGAELWDPDANRSVEALPDPPLIAGETWVATTWNGSLRQRIAFGLTCGSHEGCGMAGDMPSSEFVFARDVIVRVQDDVAPHIAVTHAPPSGWRARGQVDVGFTAVDNVGVRQLTMSLDGSPVAGTPASCYDAATNVEPRPCAVAENTFAGAVRSCRNVQRRAQDRAARRRPSIDGTDANPSVAG